MTDERRKTKDERPFDPFGSFALRPPSSVFRLLAYATVLVAFFLRCYRLADKNIWWDEGWSVWLAQKDLAWIALRTAMDEHPPLHYWLLHFWNMVAGTDAFTGRFVSLFFGVLTVALMYRIGKRVGGSWVGLLAALFLATARFHIWWSQDIKNYTPSIFFAFVAVWFGLHVIARSVATKQSPIRDWKASIAYALFAALAMWTHYLAALVLLALSIYVITVYVLRYKQSAIRPIISWILASILAALLFAPWLSMYLQNAASWQAAPTFDFVVFLKLVATVLPLGVTTNIDEYAVATIILTILSGLGILANSKIKNQNSKSQMQIENSEFRIPNSEFLFALIVILPPLLVYALSLTPVSFFAPKIQARYLLVLLPAYVMLLSFGVIVLSRFSKYLGIVTTILVLVANGLVLNDYYNERRLTDEYTTLANAVNSFARQGDVVFLHTDQEWPTFLYYLRAPLDWMGSSNGQPMNDRNAELLATRATSRYNAVWLVTLPDSLATDPQKMIEMRLANELPKRFDQTFGDKRLVLYANDARDMTNIVPEDFAPQHPRIEKIDGTAILLGYDLPVREARAGDTVRVVTYWESPASSQAQINNQLIRIPLGDRVRVQTDLVIPPDAKDDLIVRLNSIDLGRIRTEPRKNRVTVGAIPHPTNFTLQGDIHLVGYDLPQTKFRAGHVVSLTLYWRADQPIATSYTTFAHILGEQFNPKQNNPLWGQVDHIPASTTTTWLVNEIIPDAYRIAIDADAPTGKYKIEIGMYDAATGKRLSVDGSGDSVMIAEIEIVP